MKNTFSPDKAPNTNEMCRNSHEMRIIGSLDGIDNMKLC